MKIKYYLPLLFIALLTSCSSSSREAIVDKTFFEDCTVEKVSGVNGKGTIVIKEDIDMLKNQYNDLPELISEDDFKVTITDSKQGKLSNGDEVSYQIQYIGENENSDIIHTSTTFVEGLEKNAKEKAIEKKKKAKYLKSFKKLTDYKSILRRPNNYTDKKYSFDVEIAFISENDDHETQYFGYITNDVTYSKKVYFTVSDEFKGTKILKGDVVSVKGIFIEDFEEFNVEGLLFDVVYYKVHE